VAVRRFTLEENRRQAAAHHAAHEARRAFTFLLLDPSRSESLGCLYLDPLREYLKQVGATAVTLGANPPTSAMVTYWIRQDQENAGLPEVVAEAVTRWLVTDWPLDLCLFRALPDERHHGWPWNGFICSALSCGCPAKLGATSGSRPANVVAQKTKAEPVDPAMPTAVACALADGTFLAAALVAAVAIPAATSSRATRLRQSLQHNCARVRPLPKELLRNTGAVNVPGFALCTGLTALVRLSG
jgi:hypothetical protein